MAFNYARGIAVGADAESILARHFHEVGGLVEQACNGAIFHGLTCIMAFPRSLLPPRRRTLLYAPMTRPRPASARVRRISFADRISFGNDAAALCPPAAMMIRLLAKSF